MTTKAMLVGMLGLAAAVAGAACSTGTAVAAGAGAAGALYWNGRQSQAVAQGSMQDVSARARQVMSEMNIAPTNTEGAAGTDQQELHGKLNDMDITIELKPKSETSTQVEVTAKKSEVNYERGTSEQILSRILATGSDSSSTTSGQRNLNAGSTGATSGYQGMQPSSDTSRVTRTDSTGATGTMGTTTSDSTHMMRTDSTGAVRTDSTSSTTTTTTTTTSPK